MGAAVGSCGGCDGSGVCWSDGGSVGSSEVFEERVWWAEGDGCGGSAAPVVCPVLTLCSDDAP